jgi:tetratricopeptide (TPR) repeat protein
VEENKLLRRMLTDQLKHQAYREQKKRLALEQLARLQINSEELLSTINDIATPPATLSAEERDLLQDPQIKQFMTGQTIGSTIVARPDDPAAAPTPELATNPAASTPPSLNSVPPPSADESRNTQVTDAAAPSSAEGGDDLRGNFTAEMKILADAGEAAFTQSKYWEAERSFTSLIKEDPANVYGLSRLAAAQLAQRKYTEAEKSLKKATAFSTGDPFVYYLLGFSAYQQNKLEDAQNYLNLSVQLKNDNAKAHFTLGCLANRKENINVARDSFKRAIDIDPQYSDAHMNLAIIFANDGLSDDARKHYDLAIAHGAKRDPKVEKVLGVN